MDLLEFEELRRSDTTDKLPSLDREKTHTHAHLAWVKAKVKRQKRK